MPTMIWLIIFLILIKEKPNPRKTIGTMRTHLHKGKIVLSSSMMYVSVLYVGLIYILTDKHKIVTHVLDLPIDQVSKYISTIAVK